MYKISNALIIDDEIELTTQNDKKVFGDGYKSLRTIQNFFMKNSIPYSVLNQLGESPIDAIEKLVDFPKPDLVVLDLDLNSDGIIDDLDINLIRIILKQLLDTFGEFIILVYSSQSNSWPDIRQDILESDPSLSELLSLDNIIITEKLLESTVSFSEILSTEIIQKKSRYFNRQITMANDLLKGIWNKETRIILFFSICLLTVVQFTYSGSKLLFWVIIVIMLLVAIAFTSNNQDKYDANENP